MSKFRKKGKKGMPPVSTAALPDIVFMLLFFFMVSTRMRDSDELVQVSLPTASQLTIMEDKSLVDIILIGLPFDKKYGTQPCIQLNDAIVANELEIRAWKQAKNQPRTDATVAKMITSIKADSEIEMGVISKVKEQLREVDALKIAYATN